MRYQHYEVYRKPIDHSKEESYVIPPEDEWRQTPPFIVHKIENKLKNKRSRNKNEQQ